MRRALAHICVVFRSHKIRTKLKMDDLLTKALGGLDGENIPLVSPMKREPDNDDK